MPQHPNLRYYFPAEKVVPRLETADVCIYGGTSAGLAAAVQLRRLGRSVVVVHPGRWVGGLTSGGLSMTDIGHKAAIGGLARDFYRACGAAYGSAEEEWRFEPKVATAVYQRWIAEHQIPVRLGEFLCSVEQRGPRLLALSTESGLTVKARVFLDCTYEGDLMAMAGCRFTVGRESNRLYGERYNGSQVMDRHQFDFAVDPYAVPGDPASGLLPGIEPGEAHDGEGDHRVQAYNFRICMTQRPELRVPFPQPEGYDRRWYELLARYLAGGWQQVFHKFDKIRGGKTDTNNHGAVSTDFIGQNFAWPHGSYAERERIFQEHVRYIQGIQWFLANDPAVPAPIQAEYRQWGLPSDEFPDTGHWPHQLYVREARRLVGEYVMTEHECVWNRQAPEAVSLAAYGMDSHNCRRVVRAGRVWNEGNVEVRVAGPYPLSYRALLPRQSECDNLLVPVCLSASHIAYGSIRMEPVFMIVGQSCAFAADLALKADSALQDLSYHHLRTALLGAGQILDWHQPPRVVEPLARHL